MPQVAETLRVRYFAIGSIITHGNVQGIVCGLDKVRCKMRIRATKILRPLRGLQLGGIYDVPFGEGVEQVQLDTDYTYSQDMETAQAIATPSDLAVCN